MTHASYGSYESTVTVNGYGSHQVVLGGGAATYSAVVRLVDGSGQAVSGASITVGGQTLSTTAAGTATFQLANGTYPVTAKTSSSTATGTLIVNNAAAVLVLTIR